MLEGSDQVPRISREPSAEIKDDKPKPLISRDEVLAVIKSVPLIEAHRQRLLEAILDIEESTPEEPKGEREKDLFFEGLQVGVDAVLSGLLDVSTYDLTTPERIRIIGEIERLLEGDNLKLELRKGEFLKRSLFDL